MPDTEPPTGAPGQPSRRVDSRSLRALAHPLRMKILDRLALHGPNTSTGLAKELEESTGTISWHLRNLAEYGFIEEEPDRGTKRERWWRAMAQPMTVATTELRRDPDTRAALTVYLHEVVQRYFNRVVRYINEDWDDRWRSAGTFSDWTNLQLTPEQLQTLNEELQAVIARHTRSGDTAPDAGSRPVVVQIQSFPRSSLKPHE